MDVELKWHERPATLDPNDPRHGGISYYLADSGGLILAQVAPCDIYIGCYTVRTFFPESRWVGITVTVEAGFRLAELARTDTHPISRWGRDQMPIEPGLEPPKPCMSCGRPAFEGRAKCYGCDPIAVDVTPDPKLEGAMA